MILIKLEAKYKDVDSLKSIFAELIAEIEDGVESNYDGLTEFEDFAFRIKSVPEKYSISEIEF